MVPLADVAVIERVGVDAVEMAGNSYVSLEDLDSVTGEVRLVARAASKSAKFRFGPEHVLYGKLRPYLQKVARPLVCGFCSTDILPIRPNNELDRDYLFHFLRTPEFTAKASQAAVGINLPRLSPSVLSTFHIPLPPLSEQRRIAAILDKADELRAKRRAALKKLDELTQSIFLDMFGDPATNPKGWPRHRLGDVSDFFAGSTLPEGEPFTGQGEGFFLLKVSDMNLPGNDVYLRTCQQWSHVPGAASCTCPAGSIVIPKRGGAIGTNKKRITTRPSVLDPNLMAIVPRRGRTELQFLYAWLLRLDLASITSGSSVPQLNKRDLDPLNIAIPPVDSQQEFSRRLGEVEKVTLMQHATASHLDALFASLQHRAFRGEL